MPNQLVSVRMRNRMIICILKVRFYLTEDTTTPWATISQYIYIYIYIYIYCNKEGPQKILNFVFILFEKKINFTRVSDLNFLLSA